MLHRVFSASVCAFALLLTGCGDGGGKAAGDDLAADFGKAADALTAKLKEGGRTSQLPGADDPAVKAYDEQAQKGLTALGTPALPVKGFDSFQSICGKAAAIVGAYVNAGVEQKSPGTDAAAAQMSSNVERYLDQMFTPLLFAAHCSAAHMPFLEETVDTSDTSKRAAIDQVRGGAFAQVTGMIQMAGAPDMDEARRRRVLDLLASDAPNFAVAMSQPQRREVIALAQQVRGAVPADVQPQADKVRAAFEQAKCGKLCSLE
ncbi:MAG TPA: hypothetical protein VF727_08325 [Allosphingosinicella sp.]|jgi:hypothetical protein